MENDLKKILTRHKHEAVNTSQGTPVQIDIYPASTPTNNEVLVFLPALGTKASYYQGMAQAFAQRGYEVVVMELRGHGRCQLKPSRKINFGYNDLIENDLLAVVDYVAERYSSAKIILSGHSLGGQLALLFASRYQEKIAKILLIACSIPHYKYYGVLRGPGIYLASLLFNITAYMLGYFPGDRFGFGGKEARQLMFDWGRIARSGQFSLKNPAFDYEEALTQINLPVYSLSMSTDTFAPYKANAGLLDKLSKTSPVREELTPTQLGLKNISHISWVKKSDLVAQHAVELMTKYRGGTNGKE